MVNNNSSESSLYLKATNWGAYLAYYIMTYIYGGTVYKATSPYIPVLQSFTVPFPVTAIEIWFYGFMFGPVGLFYSGTGITTEPLCYAFYGTIFNATCERADCPNTNSRPSFKVESKYGNC